MNNKTNKILFVDDDPDDLEFYGESLKTVQPSLIIDEVKNGMLAMEYLQQAKKNNTLPGLIVLDVNMPIMSGKDILLEIKKDSDLLSIPIVIFSTASTPKEKECFIEYEVDFFTKPSSYSDMQELAKKILSYCG